MARMKSLGREAAVLGILLLGAAAQVLASTEELPHANHLAGEASPYLQLHAHNPVDWYPWGEEALGRARARIAALCGIRRQVVEPLLAARVIAHAPCWYCRGTRLA